MALPLLARRRQPYEGLKSNSNLTNCRARRKKNLTANNSWKARHKLLPCTGFFALFVDIRQFLSSTPRFSKITPPRRSIAYPQMRYRAGAFAVKFLGCGRSLRWASFAVINARQPNKEARR
jgi:hypothetical protein